MTTQESTVGPVNTVKCVLVGDDAAGKTDLPISCTVFDNYWVTVMVDGTPHILGLFDADCQYDHEPFKKSYRINVYYPETDVFLVCFSIANPASFESTKKKWVPEITRHKAGTPFLLVGTQMDLRNDQQTIQKLAKNKQKPITTEQGDSMAKQLKAVKFVECSALTQEGLKDVFEEAIIAAMNPPRHKRKPFCILV